MQEKQCSDELWTFKKKSQASRARYTVNVRDLVQRNTQSGCLRRLKIINPVVSVPPTAMGTAAPQQTVKILPLLHLLPIFIALVYCSVLYMFQKWLPLCLSCILSSPALPLKLVFRYTLRLLEAINLITWFFPGTFGRLPPQNF
eukprot:jgi/Mesen1/894/ME001156S00141